jgi:hypothetical protein
MNKYFIYLMLISVGLVLHPGCNFSDLNSVDKGSDTLYISRCIDTIVDTTFYSWKENGISKISSERPYIGDTIAELLPVYSNANLFSIRPIEACTCTTYVDNSHNSQATIIRDTTQRFITVHDTVYLTISPDGARLFHQLNRPWFSDSNAIRAAFDTVREGYWDRIHLAVMHFPGDSAFIVFSKQPGFITYDQKSNCQSYDFYNSAQPCFYFSPKVASSNPYYDTHSELIVAPDSTYLDSTFTWYLFVKNRFGLKDSLQIQTKVQPYTGTKKLL